MNAAPTSPPVDASAPSPAAPPARTQKMYPGLRVEIDVTPRWYAPGPHFDDDLRAIIATWGETGGDLRKLTNDFQAGTSGVRFILWVPSGVSTDAIEAARVELVDALDALDLVSPRRRAVTEARLESRSRRLRAAPPLSPPPEAPPPPADVAVPSGDEWPDSRRDDRLDAEPGA